jgi:hypothetical protein
MELIEPRPLLHVARVAEVALAEQPHAPARRSPRQRAAPLPFAIVEP